MCQHCHCKTMRGKQGDWKATQSFSGFPIYVTFFVGGGGSRLRVDSEWPSATQQGWVQPGLVPTCVCLVFCSQPCPPWLTPFSTSPGPAWEPRRLEKWAGAYGKKPSKIPRWEQISFSRKSWQNEALNYNISKSVVILLQTAFHHRIWKLGKYKTH